MARAEPESLGPIVGRSDVAFPAAGARRSTVREKFQDVTLRTSYNLEILIFSRPTVEKPSLARGR